MSTVKANSHQIGQSLTATQNFCWYQPSSPDGTVRLAVGNAGATTLDTVTVNSSGNVGIGTSSPTGYSSGKILQIFGGSTAAEINMTRTTGSDLNFINGASTAQIGTQTSYPLTFITAGSERMRLDSSGNLGLGVTPVSSYAGYKTFQIASQGLISSDSTSNGELEVNNNAYRAPTTATLTYINSFAATKYAQYRGEHRWFTAPSGTAGNAISFTQAMTLDASGRLYVGTTTQASGYDMKMVVSNDSGTTNWSIGPRVALPGTFYIAANTTYGVYLSSTSATAWASASDERLKENLIPIENAVAKISTLRAVTGNFIADEEKKSRAFLIAQDVQAVLPEAVDTSDPDKLGVAYTDTIPLLVAAIKELSAELNELKAKVNA